MFQEEYPEKEAYIALVLEEIEKKLMRGMILDGRRLDGRGTTDIRPITCEIGVLPRAHGSALFTRGETQSLVSTTLGTTEDEQMMDTIEGESWKRYMLHYNFPAFSVGEVGRFGGPGRREIGHGVLAERAIRPMIPEKNDFPYTIRIVAEILESNGSSSMASVCGGSLALMDAGVPVPQGGRGYRHGSGDRRRPCCGVERYPGRRGSPGRHGFQGDGYRGRHHRLPARHQDRRHFGRDHDEGAPPGESRAAPHPQDHERGHLDAQAGHLALCAQDHHDHDSRPTRSARSSAREARS